MINDVFVISYHNCNELLTNLSTAGIFAVETSGMFGVPEWDWWETEGFYIDKSALVIAIVDEKTIHDKTRCLALNVAVKANRPIYALVQSNNPAIIEEFTSRWNGCTLFYNIKNLIEATVSYLSTHNTFASLYIRANSYFNCGLYQESLDVYKSYFDMVKNRKNAFYGIYRNDSILEQCRIFELAASIHFILEEYQKVEYFLQQKIKLCKSNSKYAKKTILAYYMLLILYQEYHPVSPKKIEQIVSFCDKNKELSAMQEAKLFYEKCLRLQQKHKNHLNSSTIDAQDNNLLNIIAEHVEASIKLFEELKKQGCYLGYDECLSISYKRLLDYCRIIGDNTLATRCADAIARINTNYYKKEASCEEAKLNYKCIKAYLGQTIPDSGHYDAFISHKSTDTDLAIKVYNFLKIKGKVPFLDKMDLPILGTSEYRNAILESLDNSSHFILIASALEFLNSPWIKEEFNLFCDEKREGRKNGNLLMIFPQKLCEEIFASNKSNIPIQLRSFEIVSIEDFEENLHKYIV